VFTLLVIDEKWTVWSLRKNGHSATKGTLRATVMTKAIAGASIRSVGVPVAEVARV